MLMIKKTSVAGAYIKKAPYEYEGTKFEADIKSGDKVTILNSGSVVVGQYGEQQVFSIKTRNGEKNINFNQTTINILIDELGDDSETWVGNEVNVTLKKAVIAGKKVEVAYLAPEGWEIDEYGEMARSEQINQVDPMEDEIPY